MPPVNIKEEKVTLLEDTPKEIEAILGRDMGKTVSAADVITNHLTAINFIKNY